MNQLAHIDRDGPVAVAPGVIFSATPSQIVNLPTYIKGGAGAIAVFAAYLYPRCRHSRYAPTQISIEPEAAERALPLALLSTETCHRRKGNR